MPFLLLVEQNEDYYTVSYVEDQPDFLEFEPWGYDNSQHQTIYAPIGTPKITGRFDENRNHIEKAALEAKLSAYLLRNYKLFLPMLTVVGENIARILKREFDYYKMLNKEDEFHAKISKIFMNYFFTDKAFFGKLGNSNECVDTKEAFNKALGVLIKGKAIEQILFAHMAIGRIIRDYGFIAPKNKKYNDLMAKYIELLRTPDLFKNRGRAKKDNNNLDRSATTAVGYIKNEIYTVHSIKLSPHTKAVDAYGRDEIDVSDFCWNSWKKEIPFVAGPSGSGAECLACFLTFHPTSRINRLEDLQEYSACCVAYLVGSGAHSLHEVMCIAKIAGATYEEGSYLEALPTNFLHTADFIRLQQAFPNLLKFEYPIAIGSLKQYSLFKTNDNTAKKNRPSVFELEGSERDAKKQCVRFESPASFGLLGI